MNGPGHGTRRFATRPAGLLFVLAIVGVIGLVFQLLAPGDDGGKGPKPTGVGMRRSGESPPADAPRPGARAESTPIQSVPMVRQAPRLSVTDPEGHPVAAASAADGAGWSGTTDAQGMMTLGGEPREISVWARAFIVRRFTLGAPDLSDGAVARCQLERGVEITGRLVDQVGDPIANEDVVAAAGGADDEGDPNAGLVGADRATTDAHSRVAKTDAVGAFHFEGLRPGRYRIRPRNPIGFLEGGARSIPVDAPATDARIMVHAPFACIVHLVSSTGTAADASVIATAGMSGSEPRGLEFLGTDDFQVGKLVSEALRARLHLAEEYRIWIFRAATSTPTDATLVSTLNVYAKGVKPRDVKATMLAAARFSPSDIAEATLPVPVIETATLLVHAPAKVCLKHRGNAQSAGEGVWRFEVPAGAYTLAADDFATLLGDAWDAKVELSPHQQREIDWTDHVVPSTLTVRVLDARGAPTRRCRINFETPWGYSGGMSGEATKGEVRMPSRFGDVTITAIDDCFKVVGTRKVTLSAADPNPVLEFRIP